LNVFVQSNKDHRIPAPLLFLAAAAKAAAEYILGEVLFATATGGLTAYHA